MDVDAKDVGSAEAPTRDAVRASATSWALIVWLRGGGVEGGAMCVRQVGGKERGRERWSG